MTPLLWVWVLVLNVASLANYFNGNYVMAGADLITSAIATLAARTERS